MVEVIDLRTGAALIVPSRLTFSQIDRLMGTTRWVWGRGAYDRNQKQDDR